MFVPSGLLPEVIDRRCLECCRREAEYDESTRVVRQAFTNPQDQG